VNWPQRALKTAQWVVLALGLVVLAFAGPPIRRRLTTMLLALGVVLLALVAWLVVNLPQIVPAEQLAQAVTGSIPRPDTAKMPPHQAALVDRGQYLLHDLIVRFLSWHDGSGGNKISWKPFGTLYTRNISRTERLASAPGAMPRWARAIRRRRLPPWAPAALAGDDLGLAVEPGRGRRARRHRIPAHAAAG